MDLPETEQKVTPKLVSSSWRHEAATLADKRMVWTGLSGEVHTGQRIFDHLTAARKWLKENGWTPGPGKGVWLALERTVPGDADAQTVALELLGLVLKTKQNTPVHYVEFDMWEERSGRTWGEVDELLAETAQFARECGPR